MWNELSSIVRSLLARVDVRSEQGQGLVEYALILSLVSIATIVILTALGGKIGVVFSSITTAL
jgi:pilus assembly protein Flp/PilA